MSTVSIVSIASIASIASIGTFPICHVYTENGTGIYGDSRFLCYQNPFSDECEIKLTEDCKFEELFDGGEYESTGKVLKYKVPKGTTKMFLRKQK